MTDMIEEAAKRRAEAGPSPARLARDPVNRPAIRDWVAAIGDASPVYERDGVAPLAMVQVWTMRGLRPEREDLADPLHAMSAVLDEAGYTSVVATDCAQTYHRYLREGEILAVSSRLTDVVGPKRTALGEGWFVSTESTWYSGEEAVATMLFRVLKFRPGAAPPEAPPEVLRPTVSRDTEFFWQGTARGELRVQRCAACGRLRHPPGPACPGCGATEPDHVVASGTGEIYSYVVHHHPPVPGRTLPFVIVLVELAEGVRMLGELVGGGEARIGAPVKVEFVRIDDELTLPAWRLVASCRSRRAPCCPSW